MSQKQVHYVNETFIDRCAIFEPDDAVNYDYIITNSINCLLISSRGIPNGAHTNDWPIWPMLQNVSKILWCVHVYIVIIETDQLSSLCFT